jgi:hypothetical protein
MSSDSPPPTPIRLAHPLALALAERLRGAPGARILEVGSGSGRNTRALQRAGFNVVADDSPDTEPCAAALSTHALLHGSPLSIARRLAGISARIAPGAPLYATFGSIHDARYGAGTQIAPFTYAPLAGDERGVAHAFFDEARLRGLLEPHWLVESLDEHRVDGLAGTWAHREQPLRDAVHWFAIALRRA